MTDNGTKVSTFVGLASDPSLIGRDFLVREMGTVRRGPIASITTRDQEIGIYVTIRLAWVAESDPESEDGNYAIVSDGVLTYGAADMWASADLVVDGSIKINVPSAWSATILSDDTERLPMPSA